LFANTGQEDEETLIFVHECDVRWNLGVIWVEAVISPVKGAGTKHKIVTFETACRDKSLFVAMCAKYGLPNNGFMHCTRELKLRPMISYVRSIGWKAKTYYTALGIRADEADRMNSNYEEEKLFYPLVKTGETKISVNMWWNKQAFNLNLQEHYGNCTWCWKKSIRKHKTIAVERPEVFDVPRYLEENYSDAGAGDQTRRMFRSNRTTQDIFKLAQEPFEPFVDNNPHFDSMVDEQDQSSGCSESCEVFSDSNVVDWHSEE